MKNKFVKHRFRQFSSRFYPQGWYKVFRRKFPFKLHKKDWAYRIAKLNILKFFRFKKKLTFFDSSFTHFLYLGNSKSKKIKNRMKLMSKFVERDAEIEYFPGEIYPEFISKNKKQMHTRIH